MRKYMGIAVLGLAMVSCVQPDSNIEKEIDIVSGRTVCIDPRPEMCTREYNPVCARLTDNKDKTYATGCTACSDIKVISYIPGRCPISTD